MLGICGRDSPFDFYVVVITNVSEQVTFIAETA